MSIFKSRSLTLITAVYWFLLAYVITALIFWFLSLQKQNRQMTVFKLNDLQQNDPLYKAKSAKVYEEQQRKEAQYIGEGVTFFALILVAAVFVYRATRRQFRLSLQQQNFMMAITHELKTPIAVAKLNLETLQRRKLDETQQHKLLNVTLQETNRLDTLCNNILLASQYDAGAYKMNKTLVDLSEVVETTCEDFIRRYPNRIIDANIIYDIEILGEDVLLQMLASNLLENAVKYSSKDKPIKIELSKNNSHINLVVTDEGAGIVEKERAKIFDKFYRIGNESTRMAKGTGLGLYLCKKIAQDHNAQITVSNNQPVGSIFTVSFKI